MSTLFFKYFLQTWWKGTQGSILDLKFIFLTPPPRRRDLIVVPE